MAIQEKSVVLDKVGTTIEVGDIIAWASGSSGGGANLRIGTVTHFTEKSICVLSPEEGYDWESKKKTKTLVKKSVSKEKRENVIVVTKKDEP